MPKSLFIRAGSIVRGGAWEEKGGPGDELPKFTGAEGGTARGAPRLSMSPTSPHVFTKLLAEGGTGTSATWGQNFDTGARAQPPPRSAPKTTSQQLGGGAGKPVHNAGNSCSGELTYRRPYGEGGRASPHVPQGHGEGGGKRIGAGTENFGGTTGPHVGTPVPPLTSKKRVETIAAQCRIDPFRSPRAVLARPGSGRTSSGRRGQP